MLTKNKLESMLGITGAVILILLVIVILPVVGIWIINTLFGTSTAYTFWTWLASALFFGFFSIRSSNSK